MSLSARLRRARDAERGDIILRDPGGELHQFSGEQGRVVEDLLHGLDFNTVRRAVIVHADDDSHEALPAEWHQHARANRRHGPVDGVSEGAVERNGQGNVAKGGHVGFEICYQTTADGCSKTVRSAQLPLTATVRHSRSEGRSGQGGVVF
jgi:hypothetical protein